MSCKMSNHIKILSESKLTDKIRRNWSLIDFYLPRKDYDIYTFYPSSISDVRLCNFTQSKDQLYKSKTNTCLGDVTLLSSV